MTGKRQRYKGLFISSDTLELNRTVIFIGTGSIHSNVYMYFLNLAKKAFSHIIFCFVGFLTTEKKHF